MLGSSDIPQAAAIFAYYGFPDPDKKWGDKPMTFGTLVERFGKEKDKDPTLIFLDFFYGLIQQLVIASLKAQNPKTTKELLVTVMGNKKLWQSDFKKFERELSVLERRFKLTLVEDKLIKRLGGGQLPPPYLVWVAYAFSFKLAYGAETELKFDKLPEINLDFSAKGDAGFYFDIGAAWTMTRELGAAYTGIDFKKDKEKKSEKPPSHPFEKSLHQILDFADLQIGAAVKLVAEGNLKTIIDLFSRGQDIKRFKLDPEDPPSLVIKMEAPIYSKFSKIQMKYKCIKCDLMFLTGSAIAFMPTGLYLGDNLVWNGSDGMRFPFDKDIGLGEILELKSPKKDFMVGEPILSMIDATDKLIPGKPGQEAPFLQTFLQAGNDLDKIELDTKAVAGSKADVRDANRYDKGMHLTSSFVIQPSKLATDEKYKAFVKKLIREGCGGEFLCRYAGDFNRTTIPPHPNLQIKTPKIGQFNIENEKQLYRFEDVVKIRFNLLNCQQKDVSLFCSVVEDTGGNIYSCTGKQGKPSYFKCFYLADKNQYGCKVPLYELSEIKRKLPEIGNWDICFRISLDTKAEFSLLFDSLGRDYSKDIQVKKD